MLLFYRHIFIIILGTTTIRILWLFVNFNNEITFANVFLLSNTCRHVIVIVIFHFFFFLFLSFVCIFVVIIFNIMIIIFWYFWKVFLCMTTYLSYWSCWHVLHCVGGIVLLLVSDYLIMLNGPWTKTQLLFLRLALTRDTRMISVLLYNVIR